MRRVLVERYRRRGADKRGAGQTLLNLNAELDSAGSREIELERLDDALSTTADSKLRLLRSGAEASL